MFMESNDLPLRGPSLLLEYMPTHFYSLFRGCLKGCSDGEMSWVGTYYRREREKKRMGDNNAGRTANGKTVACLTSLASLSSIDAFYFLITHQISCKRNEFGHRGLTFRGENKQTRFFCLLFCRGCRMTQELRMH